MALDVVCPAWLLCPVATPLIRRTTASGDAKRHERENDHVRKEDYDEEARRQEEGQSAR
jgi:hypothetical protein